MQGLEALYTEKDFVLPGQSLSSQLSLHGLPSSRAHCARPLPRVTFNKGNCAHCAEPLSLDLTLPTVKTLPVPYQDMVIFNSVRIFDEQFLHFFTVHSLEHPALKTFRIFLISLTVLKI